MKKVPALFGSSTFIRLFCNRSLVEVSLSSGIEGGNPYNDDDEKYISNQQKL